MPNGWGGKRPGAGRKKKEIRQDLQDRLSPYDETALGSLIEGVKKGEAWAIKLFFEYRWGKPTEHVSIEHESQAPAKIYFVDSSNDDEQLAELENSE